MVYRDDPNGTMVYRDDPNDTVVYRDDPNESTTTKEHHDDFRDAETDPPFDAEHSLPAAEELHTAIAIADARLGRSTARSSSKQRRSMICLLLAVATLGAIVGFSVGLTMRKKNEEAATASASTAEASQAERYDDVVEFLSHFTPQSALEENDSPQNKAAKWLADVDQRQVAIPPSTDYDTAYFFLQRYVLALLYYSQDGYNWKYPQTNFLEPTSECNWNFRMTSSMPVPGSGRSEWIMGAACNQIGEINYLFLPHNNLRGTLPLELKYLHGMEHFSLFNNEIVGPFPNVADWTKLSFLAVESNQLIGPIGDWFNFPNLEYLALGDNQFTGPLPSFDGFPKLREVALDTNHFTGPVDVFNGATSLEILYLQENAFTGALSEETFKDLTLTNLDLSDNLLTGTIPEHFFRYSIVDVHNNSLTGQFPDVTGSDYPIRFLSIFNNGISGSLPESIGLMTGLTHLDVSYNKFTGNMPNSLNNLVNMEYLFMQHNTFTTGIMPPIWQLTNLLELSLRATNRADWLHRWLGDSFSKLVLMDLSDNGFYGTIPQNWGTMNQLRFLFLSKNQLNSTIPSSFTNLTDISILLLDNNLITGTDEPVCGLRDGKDLAYFSGDCSEFTCSCCTKCCAASDPTCTALEMKVNFDDGYTRDQFVFSENLIFDSFENVTMGNT